MAVIAIPAFAEQGTGGIALPPPPPAGADQIEASGGSASGYASASPTQAEDLFTSNFAQTIDSLASDPSDLSGQHPTFLDNYTAVVSPSGSPVTADEIASVLSRDQHDVAAARADLDSLLSQDQGTDGPHLISSVLPLRVTDGSGPAPVDLSLDDQGPGFVADNPLVNVQLPETLGGAVNLADQGIQLEVGGDGAATADPIDGGEALFYADAAQATDVVLAPISTVLETFYQLRGPESPEHLRLSLNLPEGAHLGETGGGAEIVHDGDTLGAVYPPAATDAAGSPVDVTMSVDGNDLVLDVPHSDPGIRYPISVDPVVDVYTWSTNGGGRFTDWVANQTAGSPYQLRTTCVSGINCQNGAAPTGLYVEVPANSAVTNPSSGNWQYTVPQYPWTTAFISKLDLGPMNFTPRSDTNANPFMFAGVYADNTSSYLASASQTTAASNLHWSFDPPTYATSGQKAVLSLWSWANRTVTAWRDAYLGGASVTLADTEPPDLTNVAHAGISIGQDDWSYSDWVDDATSSVSVTAQDNGLGIKSLMVPRADGSLRTVSESCDGTNGSPCPLRPDSVTATYDTSQMPTGANITGVVATDAVDKSAARTFVVRVDHAAPQIALSDDLYVSRANPVTHEFSNLHVEVSDGDSTSGSTWQSGVRSLEIQVDGQREDYYTQECPRQSGSCSLDADWELYGPDETTGSHTVRVIATDQLGHTSQRTFDVIVGDIQSFDPLPGNGDVVDVAGPDGEPIRCADGQKLIVPVDLGPPPEPDTASEEDELASDSSTTLETTEAPPLAPRCPLDGASQAARWIDAPGESDIADSAPPIQKVARDAGGVVDQVHPAGAAAGFCVWAYSEVAFGVYNNGYVESTTENLNQTYEGQCVSHSALGGNVDKAPGKIATAYSVYYHRKDDWHFCVRSDWDFNDKKTWGNTISWNFRHPPCGHGTYKNRTKARIYYSHVQDHWRGGHVNSPHEHWPGLR
ncbi:MAG TPA: hypothetical protein VF190_10545 [Rhodothermales bacterium]